MGQGRRPPKKMARPRDGGSIVSGSGAVVFDCRFSATIGATAIGDVVSGKGSLAVDGDVVVLMSAGVEIAVLDAAQATTTRLHHCLSQGFQFSGTLSTDGDHSSVHVRPRTWPRGFA